MAWLMASMTSLAVLVLIDMFTGHPHLNSHLVAAVSGVVFMRQKRVLLGYLLAVFLATLMSAIELPPAMPLGLQLVALMWGMRLSFHMPSDHAERVLARAGTWVGSATSIASVVPGTVVKLAGRVRALQHVASLDGDRVVWSSIRFSNRQTLLTRRTRFSANKGVDFMLEVDGGPLVPVQIAASGLLWGRGGDERRLPTDLATRLYERVPAHRKQLEFDRFEQVYGRETLLRDGDRVAVLGVRVDIPGEGLPRAAASVPAIGSASDVPLLVLPLPVHGPLWYTVQLLRQRWRRALGRSATPPATVEGMGA